MAELFNQKQSITTLKILKTKVQFITSYIFLG